MLFTFILLVKPVLADTVQIVIFYFLNVPWTGGTCEAIVIRIRRFAWFVTILLEAPSKHALLIHTMCMFWKNSFSRDVNLYLTNTLIHNILSSFENYVECN